MVPMQVRLKDTLVEESERWFLRFPQSVVQHHFVALSEIWLLNSAVVEGHLPERENIGWRFSAIIQFHVHVQRGQSSSAALQLCASPCMDSGYSHLSCCKRKTITSLCSQHSCSAAVSGWRTEEPATQKRVLWHHSDLRPLRSTHSSFSGRLTQSC